MHPQPFTPNVILVDASYIDRVAFNLIVNFERMLERRIPPANLYQWLDYIALDGGLRPEGNQIQAHFLYAKEQPALQNFKPADFKAEIDGQSYSDRLGRFSLLSYPVEPIVTPEQMLCQSIQMLLASSEVKRLFIVADTEQYGGAVKRALSAKREDTEIMLFSMQPLAGGTFKNEILGYSLMAALGIRGDELK